MGQLSRKRKRRDGGGGADDSPNKSNRTVNNTRPSSASAATKTRIPLTTTTTIVSTPNTSIELPRRGRSSSTPVVPDLMDDDDGGQLMDKSPPPPEDEMDDNNDGNDAVDDDLEELMLSQRLPSQEMMADDDDDDGIDNDEDNDGFADGFNYSFCEPSHTQIQRNVSNLQKEAEELAKLNEPECGTLESITLQNFMCHSNFHLDFGPRINFIVGRNGSGKSAILTAIVLVFGGRATATARGKGVQSFIKSGESAAKIILKICNSTERTGGQRGFKEELYGQSIIIERSISLSASSYKLKSSDGRVVAEGRDALNDIIRYFNIQVDNPICVLNQEVSRNFLNTKNSRDKYQFFMRATLLEDMKNDYANSEEQRLSSEQKLMDKKKIIPMTAKDIGDLERKVKLFNQLENQREKFLQLNNEAIWSLVYEQKQSVQLVRNEVEKLDKRLSAEQKKLTESTERLDELRRKETECMEQSNSLFENTNKANEVKDEYKRRLQAIKEELQATEARDRGLRTEIISINNDIKALQLKIEELEQQYSNESHTKRKLDIQKLRENIDELNTKEQSLVDSIQEFNQTVQQLTEEGLRHTQDDRQLKSMIDGKRRDMERLKGSRNDRLSRFGPQFSELVRRIDDSHKRGLFKHKPLGPIGYHLQLTDYRCALAVEICLKGLIYGFCCDNMDDKRQLDKIFQQVFRGQSRMPSIITRPFGPLHDVDRHRVRHPTYKSFYDLIKVKETPIANCLIDQFRIEQILYVPDYNSARDLMLTSPPDNCFQTYTEDGAVMYPQTEDQDFKTYANNNRQSVKVLVKSVDEMIQRFSAEIDDLCRKERSVQELVDRNRQEITGKREELARIEQQKRQTRRDLVDQQSELQRLESIGDSPPVEVSTLEESLQQSTDKKSELDLCLEEIRDEKERLANQYQELDDEYRLRKTEYEDLLASRHPLKESLEKCKSDIRTHQTALNEFQKKVRDTESLKTEEETKLAVKESEYEDFERQALAKTGEPVRTRRSSKTVQIEIRQLQQFLAEQETTIGNKEQIYRQYKDLSQQFRRIKQDVHTIETNLIRLKESLNLRRRGYVELRSFYSVITQFFFMDVLQHKGFTGSLDIYHQNKEVNGEQKKAKTLEIRVNPKASATAADSQCSSTQLSSTSSSTYSDTRSLSGGERSYSTVAFILALWESAHSPFKILDEVDVFMDLVTRKISLDAMIEFASSKCGKQFIFLSPLKLQNLPNPDLIKVFQMPEPKRNSSD